MPHRCPFIGPVLLHGRTFAFVLSNALQVASFIFQGYRRLLVGNRFPPKRLAKASASGLTKQNTATVIAAQEVSQLRRRSNTCSAKYRLAIHEARNLFGRERHVMRPSALEIVGDFAPARFLPSHGQ
jgi:hypothetical protein